MRLAAGRVVDLIQLRTELAAAGVNVAALAVSDDGTGPDIRAVDAQGVQADLPAPATAVLAAHAPSTALRDQLVSALTALVGIQIGALTQPQVGLLMRAVLYKFGAIDRQGQIRPLDQWLVN